MELKAISSAVPPQRLDSTATPKQVAAQFEAMLLNQMFNEMQKTVEKSDLFGDGAAEELYQELLNRALSDEVARRGGMGLAEQLTQQIERIKTHHNGAETYEAAPANHVESEEL